MSRTKSIKTQKEKAEVDKIRAETAAIRLGTLKDFTTILTILFATFASVTAVRPADTNLARCRAQTLVPARERAAVAGVWRSGDRRCG